MSLYRLKQFIWAVTAPFKPIDRNILNEYLNRSEMKLFQKMKLSEQHHCIRVCKDSLIKSEKLEDIDKRKLAKIALLHDVGKIEGNLNVLDKSIIVILDKVTKGNLKKYTFNKKVDVYYNHPQRSLKLLKKIDIYDKEFLEAIGNHHQRYNCKNKYLEIVRQCDDSN